jgi:Uma2 family endonuclease
MVTEIDAPPRVERGVIPYRLTVEQFDKMIAAGVFPDRIRVELLGGVLVRKMTKNDPHDFAVGELGARINRLLEPAWFAREEKSVVLGKYWRPEPDVAVVRGPRDRYRSAAPRIADLGLLIEVSDVSYAKDRGLKWRRYAAVGLGSYWIVNLNQRRIEVYSRPEGRGEAAAYKEAAFYGPDDEVPVILEGRERGLVMVRDLLP